MKETEEIVGDNLAIIHMRVGNLHVSQPLKDALQCCRPRHMRDMPVAMRRGWVKAVKDVWAENRKVYNQVMNLRG
jgi:hypothetical protein